MVSQNMNKNDKNLIGNHKPNQLGLLNFKLYKISLEYVVPDIDPRIKMFSYPDPSG